MILIIQLNIRGHFSHLHTSIKNKEVKMKETYYTGRKRKFFLPQPLY